VLLPITASWRYNTNNFDATPTWKSPSYVDSAWPGPSPALLYIENIALAAPTNTVLPARSGGGPMLTYYFRTTFTCTNVANVSSLLFSNLVDDGAVLYLNSTEIKRLNMSAGTITYTNLSTASHEATSWDIFSVTGSALTNLVEGQNTLAAEVHQQAANSTDIVFGAAVTAIYGQTTNVTRGPYLQCSTPTSIVIRWRTDLATDSRVDYGTTAGALNQSVVLAPETGEHIVTLTNLTPDIKYFYTIGTSDRLLAGPSTNHFFLTHPLPGTTKPVRIWVIGDAGTAPLGVTQAANQAAVRTAFQTYNGTNTLHAWLQLGDNAYNEGTDAQYQTAVFDMYAALLRNSVTWSTLGNHETAQSTAFVDSYPYFDMFTLPTAGEAGGVPSATEHWYSFDLGMVHFVCLDSMTANRATNGAMADWLRTDLALNTNRWVIAFFHHPPYSKGSHDSDVGGSGYNTQMGEMRTNFLPILEAGGVDLVLSGHCHSYERSKLISGHYGISSTFNAGTHVIQTGSGRETNGVGAYLKPDGHGERPVGNRGTIYAVAGSSGQATTGTGLNHPAMYYSAMVLGSMVLDFKSNRLDAVFLRETGATDDSFSIIKEGTNPPRLTNASTSGNNLQFTVLCRAYRTNIVEASTNVAAGWTGIFTNIPTAAAFNFTDTNALAVPQKFYRVRKR
jgi:hypothetical protein